MRVATCLLYAGRSQDARRLASSASGAIVVLLVRVAMRVMERGRRLFETRFARWHLAPREPPPGVRESTGVSLLHAADRSRDRGDASAIAASLESPAAFAVVFERHHPAVHRYLSRRIGTDLADELAAETFAVAFAKRGRFDTAVQDARPWLFGIATKLAHRHWRREERELRAYARTGVDAVSPGSDEGVAARADSAAAGRALAAALAALSADERDVLLLYAWEQLDSARDRGRAVDRARHRQVAAASRPRTRS